MIRFFRYHAPGLGAEKAADPKERAKWTACAGPCGGPPSLCVCDPQFDKLTRQIVAVDREQQRQKARGTR